MANFYVTNSKFPANPQLFTITLNKIVPLEPEDNPNVSPQYSAGESFWKVFIYTSGKDNVGEDLPPVVADVVGSSETVDEFIERAVADFCAQIDWSQQGQFNPETDKNAPTLVEQFPAPNQIDVPISSPVVLRVKDLLPGIGINPNTVSMKIDGFDVSPDVTGNKFDYTFSFSPRPVFNE